MRDRSVPATQWSVDHASSYYCPARAELELRLVAVGEGRARVGQHEHVRVLRVLEVPENAVFLAQARQEVSGKPKVLVQFHEKNGVLTGVITQRLAGSTVSHCSLCKGKQKGQPLEGLQIISQLKPDGAGGYQNGEILDPKTGKTYSLKGKLSKDGQKLELRGFLGFSLLGRDQTWTREK